MPATLPPDSGITRDLHAGEALASGLSLLVIAEGAVSSHDLPASGTVTLGRAPTCDVVVDDPSVSRAHAVLHLGTPMELEDSGSVNGTRVPAGAVAAGARVPIALDEPIGLGSVTVIVQRRVAVRPRRVWSHGYFEGRLEDECARAERFGQGFALLHIVLERDLHADVVRGAMSDVLRSVDVLGSYGPSEYEILLVATTREEADLLAERVRGTLSDRGGRPRLGLAHYPTDGRSPDVLAALAREQVRGPHRTTDIREVVVRSDRMRELHALVSRVAGGDISVLLLGETGSGKEVIAETIHRLSPRAGGPFLRLNCAALSETLLESELFGHERGSFTGATHSKPGLLETAAGGTVFLDEIGELPMSVQVKLLRVLEERKVLRVGALAPVPIDVRFVAATNRDLEAEIRRFAFREDLYYRLNGISVWIPPLRERVVEIEPLARQFIGEFCRRNHRYPEPDLQPAALDWLERYRWPGNIRELRNVIERAVLLCTGDEITPRQLPIDKMESALAPAEPGRRHAPTAEVVPVPSRTGLHRPASVPGDRPIDERGRIMAALEECAGNQTRAAVMLGISRRTLVNRLNEYGLARPRKRTQTTEPNL